MSELKNYWVANAVHVEIENHRVIAYCELGKVLVDYNGKDQINDGKKYIIINGNVKPSDLSYFEISRQETDEIEYLYEVTTFYEYIRSNSHNIGIYAFQLLHRKDLTKREVTDSFKMFFPEYYNKDEKVKKLQFI